MEKPAHMPKMRRTSALINLTPGSVLSKRIAYSRDSVRVPIAIKRTPSNQDKLVMPKIKVEPSPSVAKSCQIPRLVNPDSSLAKRYAYSVKRKGKSDPLSEEMRSYFKNTSMIDTWLRSRVMQEIREEQDSLKTAIQDASPTPPPENSYFSEPCSALARRQEYSSKPAGERDALQPETREYCLYQSQLQTWGEERIVRAIYSWINRKYGGPSPLTVFLRPTRRFITCILHLMPPYDRSLERLLRLVEEQWIKPRYVHYYQYFMIKRGGFKSSLNIPKEAIKAVP